MTATLTEKYDKYYVVLNWVKDGQRKRKWISTDLPVKGNNKRRAEKMCAEALSEWE